MREETIFYQNSDGSVVITDTRFVIGTSTYPLSGITAVSVREEIHKGSDALRVLVASLVGFVLFVTSLVLLGKLMDAPGPTFILSCILTIIGTVLAVSPIAPPVDTREQHLVFNTAGGQVSVFSSTNADQFQSVRRAVDDAIVFRR